MGIFVVWCVEVAMRIPAVLWLVIIGLAILAGAANAVR